MLFLEVIMVPREPNDKAAKATVKKKKNCLQKDEISNKFKGYL